jgi:hypothetical protein
MSRRENIPDGFDDPDAKCNFCGDRPWSVMWSGIPADPLHESGHIYLCQHCALNKLPALLADATWKPNLRQQDAHAALERAAGIFWRVLHLHASLHLRKLQDEPPVQLNVVSLAELFPTDDEKKPS